jgi:hypothetical protein
MAMNRLPRKVFGFVTAIVCAVWLVPAGAYQNEPKGFGGMKWGESVLGLSELVLVLDGGALKAYVRKGDDMVLGGAQLDRLHYIFYRDRFYCVHMEFSGPESFGTLRDVLVDWYGPGEEKKASGLHVYWVGETTSVTLNYNAAEQKGELGYKYMPIDAQIEQEEGRITN